MLVDMLLYALLAQQRPRPPRPEPPPPLLPVPIMPPPAAPTTVTDCEEYEARLIMGPGAMLINAFYASFFVILLGLIHFALKAIQDCLRRPTTYARFWRYFGHVKDRPVGEMAGGGTQDAQKASDVTITVEGTCFDRMQRCFLPRDEETNEYLPLYMVVKVEGQAFANFLVLSALEAVLALTGVYNAELAGDFEYANDPTGLVSRVSWGLVLGNIALLVAFVVWFRRLRGHTGCLCLFNSAGKCARSALPTRPARPPPLREACRAHDRRVSLRLASPRRRFFVKPEDQTAEQRANVRAMTRLIELVTLTSLAISVLQVVIGAVVSASQISDGSMRGTRQGNQQRYLAKLINTVEVGAVLLAKLYSLYQWYDVYQVYKPRKTMRAPAVQEPTEPVVAAGD